MLPRAQCRPLLLLPLKSASHQSLHSPAGDGVGAKKVVDGVGLGAGAGVGFEVVGGAEGAGVGFAVPQKEQ
eukprot:CAMPEP_0172717260 /NCGR_PEP_ID=MMETSP1074-20121228/70865_1 /TAXON_ID=2916 /ORGANISM="Ceratium fusus, Strain PA161109" /LENGTH=70 /DNA_ID=CAMNT_0013542153 /DNA_START=31 /DNA_END=240 /DNA_ORIENTATION=-